MLVKPPVILCRLCFVILNSFIWSLAGLCLPMVQTDSFLREQSLELLDLYPDLKLHTDYLMPSFTWSGHTGVFQSTNTSESFNRSYDYRLPYDTCFIQGEDKSNGSDSVLKFHQRCHFTLTDFFLPTCFQSVLYWVSWSIRCKYEEVIVK